VREDKGTLDTSTWVRLMATLREVGTLVTRKVHELTETVYVMVRAISVARIRIRLRGRDSEKPRNKSIGL
jgi:hypothetical protein